MIGECKEGNKDGARSGEGGDGPVSRGSCRARGTGTLRQVLSRQVSRWSWRTADEPKVMRDLGSLTAPVQRRQVGAGLAARVPFCHWAGQGEGWWIGPGVERERGLGISLSPEQSSCPLMGQGVRVGLGACLEEGLGVRNILSQGGKSAEHRHEKPLREARKPET